MERREFLRNAGLAGLGLVLASIPGEGPKEEGLIDWMAMSSGGAVERLEREGPYSLGDDFLRDRDLVEAICKVRKVDLGEQPERFNAYLIALSNYFNTGFIIKDGFLGDDPYSKKERVSNVSLDGVPLIGGCSESAMAALFTSYRQFPELFNQQGSLIYGALDTPLKGDQNTKDGHSFGILKPYAAGEPIYIFDNGMMTSLHDENNRIRFGPYKSIPEILEAIWKKTEFRHCPLNWITLYHFNDIQKALLKPVIRIGIDLEEIEKDSLVFQNEQSRAYYDQFTRRLDLEQKCYLLGGFVVMALAILSGLVGLEVVEKRKD